VLKLATETNRRALARIDLDQDIPGDPASLSRPLISQRTGAASLVQSKRKGDEDEAEPEGIIPEPGS
jgi:hypothetical protein